MEQRRSKRFPLELPLAVTRNGPERVSQAGQTRNISSGGVLFTFDRAIDVGGPIEYIITLANEKEATVNLRCVGKVLRLQRESADGNGSASFAVAATLERYEFVRSDS